jgi:hypothetical protein
MDRVLIARKLREAEHIGLHDGLHDGLPHAQREILKAIFIHYMGRHCSSSWLIKGFKSWMGSVLRAVKQILHVLVSASSSKKSRPMRKTLNQTARN